MSVFLFYVFVFCFVHSVFLCCFVNCFSFYIAVSFLFFYKFADRCHRVETQLQETNIISYMNYIICI